MKPELIIFDCDGTIADTEYMHQLAVIGALEKFGFTGYNIEFCLNNFVGRGMNHVQKIVEEREGRTVPDEFLPQYMELCTELMSKGLEPIPGAIEAVRELAKDYKICVASNGEAETVVKTVTTIGLLNDFGREHIYTKSQVKRGKPAPDLFLFAAEQMGVAPEACVVIEDSIAGVTAGLTAGMETIGIIGVSHDPQLVVKNMKNAGVRHIYDTWPEIIALIKTL